MASKPIQLRAEFHKRLKELASYYNTSMSKLVEQAVEFYHQEGERMGAPLPEYYQPEKFYPELDEEIDPVLPLGWGYPEEPEE